MVDSGSLVGRRWQRSNLFETSLKFMTTPWVYIASANAKNNLQKAN